MAKSVLAPVRKTFRAVVRCVVPEATNLSDVEWNDVEVIVERALALRPEKMRRQLALLLRAIELLPVARHGKRFSRLTSAQQTTMLRALQDSRVLVLRRGFWGLRTLALMGYYARPSAAQLIGYRASAQGWSAR